jgi:hypothetical protein
MGGRERKGGVGEIVKKSNHTFWQPIDDALVVS